MSLIDDANQKNEFGYSLGEMDTEAFFNMRDWLQSALESKGARVTGAALRCGKADLWFEHGGHCFFVSIQPASAVYYK